MSDNNAPYMSPAEAARYLCTTVQGLANDRCSRRWCIPYYKLGAKVLYSKTDLDAYIASRRTDPAGVEQ